jgi:hypothetical protein
MSFKVATPLGVNLTNEEIREVEEQVFQLASKMRIPLSKGTCIVVNKPQYFALKHHRAVPGFPVPEELWMCGYKILPGWCSKPVVVEID